MTAVNGSRQAAVSTTVAPVRRRVMQMTDALAPGGKERVVVNLANLLPRDGFDSYLCTTRAEGPLADLILEDVGRLKLSRRRRFDLQALRALVAFNAAHQIDVMHAHGTSVFMAVVASLFAPHPAVVFHDHYGPYRFDDRPTWLYRMAASRIDGVITVNEPLAEWATRRLKIPAPRVWYIPNFACESGHAANASLALPGTPGRRIVCVARLRPQKDHATLFDALALVGQQVPDAHLLLVGDGDDARYEGQLRAQVERLGLGPQVSFLGLRRDVGAILAQSDIGVLSSASEGFPLALIEYGLAGLASVSTAVGQCPEVLEGGAAGSLVPPGDPRSLADVLIGLLNDAPRREACGQAFRRRVDERYAPGAIIEQICRVYETIVPRPGTRVPSEGRIAGARPSTRASVVNHT